MSQAIKKPRARRVTTPPEMIAPIPMFFDLAPVAIAGDEVHDEDDETGWMEEDPRKSYLEKLSKVVMSVNGRRAVSKKWLKLTVVHDVVEPNRSLEILSIRCSLRPRKLAPSQVGLPTSQRHGTCGSRPISS
jgi:hypothetical protein